MVEMKWPLESEQVVTYVATWRYICDTYLISGVKDILFNANLNIEFYRKHIFWKEHNVTCKRSGQWIYQGRAICIRVEFQYVVWQPFSTNYPSITSLFTIQEWWEEMSGIVLNIAILEFVPWKVIIDAIRAKTCCLLSSICSCILVERIVIWCRRKRSGQGHMLFPQNLLVKVREKLEVHIGHVQITWPSRDINSYWSVWIIFPPYPIYIASSPYINFPTDHRHPPHLR